jgi:hypothetical protein
MTVNEAGWDRGVRVVAGLVLLYLGFSGTVAGTLGTVFSVLGFLPLLTGIVGYCPAYSLFGISTCKVKA